MQEIIIYTILYLLFSICIIFPPIEFISAGFTVSSIFSFLLGEERFDFVGYQLRRTIITSFIHSCLPFVHLVYLLFKYCKSWDSHPTVKLLKYFDSNWVNVANDINEEYRNLNNFSISLSGINKVIMTNSWILNITNYSLICAQISDVALQIIHADEHQISHHEPFGGSVQFVNIEVKSLSGKFETFIIRIQADSFRDMQDKINKPISIAKEVILRQSLNDRFIEAFVEQVRSNPRFDYRNVENLEPCLACASELPNIKLNKNCISHEEIDFDGEPRPLCTQCYCRPMWCVRCMSLIFAAKQDRNHPERWMPGKASCPTCRAIFCVLDVSFLS
ncbi:unnamed protein product [Dracunculus medinensis]|uniref:Transmembrane protein 129 n=1 Tax=Dracunculus medinensis TaxID=318479 RepID=A0A158Q4W2_DRAME|nr:unnamed protein product [Dracunculus medinensis]